MKRLFVILALVGSMAAMASCSATQSAAASEKDAATQQLVQQMLDKRMYKVDFDRAFPMAGPSFALNYPYFVSVIGDRVESFLPYFGRAYTIPFGGGEGLSFEAPITGYSVKEGKKGQHLITFNARSDEDDYTFNLEIYPTGEAFLNINAINKQGMSFDGNMDLDPKFEVIKVKTE